MKDLFFDALTSAKATGVTVVYTVGGGVAALTQTIQAELATIATVSGIALTWMTIAAHVAKIRRSHREHELGVQKLALEIDLLKAEKEKQDASQQASD